MMVIDQAREDALPPPVPSKALSEFPKQSLGVGLDDGTTCLEFPHENPFLVDIV